MSFFRIQKRITGFFGISKREANGVIPLLIVFIFLFFTSFWWKTERLQQGENQDMALLDSLTYAFERVQQYSSQNYGKSTYRSAKDAKSLKKEQWKRAVISKGEAFFFDPNTISKDSALLLGLKPRVVKHIMNYRNKGGRFYVKKDLRKIYGLSDRHYQHLEAFIILPEVRPSVSTFSKKAMPLGVQGREVPLTFDVNSTDTTSLKKIKGIGTVLSGRIVKFRDKLGGFVDEEQLSEVYGLNPEALAQLKEWTYITEKFIPVKININEADEKILSTHPYISKALAKSIVHYRYQHGDFNTIEELLQLHSVDSTVYLKILPYIAI